ncbi:MAG: hypothetical protein JWM86_480 [Thermoleophilia bacterium]|nr:hypothetical protein [Thermoleophilia bacterium]
MGAIGAIGGVGGGLGPSGGATGSSGWFDASSVMDTGSARVDGRTVTYDDGGLKAGVGTLGRTDELSRRVDPMDTVAKVAATYLAYKQDC